jgi:hypothetical protein
LGVEKSPSVLFGSNEREEETTPLTNSTGHAKCTSKFGGEAAGDGQAQTDAALVGSEGVRRAKERREDVSHVT